MAYDQTELGRRFRRGETSGEASNMSIEEYDNGTGLIGYGHALYAFRTDDGTIIYFSGWYDRSQSTKCQIGKSRLRTNANAIVPTRRKRRNPPTDDEVDAWLDAVTSTDAETNEVPQAHV